MFNRIAKFKYIFIALILLIMLNLKADNGVRLGDPSQIVNPKHVKDGIVFTNENGSALYLLKENKIEELFSTPSCRMYNISPDQTKIGFRLTDTTDWQRTPAVYDLIERKITKLNKPSESCTNVSFSENGKMAYVKGHTLFVHSGSEIKTFESDNMLAYSSSSISPNGLYFLYRSNDHGLCLLNLETGEIKDVNVGFKDEFIPQGWSPDSKKFIFNVHGNICTYNIQEEKLYRITVDKGDLFVKGEASWYDADHIVYRKHENKCWDEILLLDLFLSKYDGTDEIRLTNSINEFESRPSVNLKTKEIIYHNEGGKELISIKLDNKGVKKKKKLFQAGNNFRRKIYKKKILE